MKLSIVQIILAILIIGIIILYTQFILPGYYQEIIVDGDGRIVGKLFGMPVRNPLWEAWIMSYGILAVCLFIISIFRFIKALRHGTSTALALSQIALGVLIVGSLVFYLIGAEPHYILYSKLMEHNGFYIIQKEPAWIVNQILWKEAGFLSGLLVITFGVIDFCRTRKTIAKI